MADKAIATSVDEKIYNDFKGACARNGFSIKTVLETFMKAYAAGRFKIEIEYERNQLEEK